MNINIYYHSSTGHTDSVLARLAQKFQGIHQMNFYQLKALNDREVDPSKVKLIEQPEIIKGDLLIFAGPVRGFSLSSIISAFILKADSLDRPCLLLLTQYFPFSFMGGQGAMRQFKALITNKNGLIKATSIINWSIRKKTKAANKQIYCPLK